VSHRPELEHQQGPQLLSVVGDTVEMTPQEQCNISGVKNPLLPEAVTGQQVTGKPTEFLAQPEPGRHAESVLWPTHDRSRKPPTGHAAQQRFGPPQPAPTRCRKTEDVLCELAIKERRTHLKPGGH